MVCLSVCLSCLWTLQKMSELVKMPYEGLSHVGPSNHGVKVGRIHLLPRGVTSRWFWHTGKLHKNEGTDRDAVWGLSQWPKEACVRWGQGWMNPPGGWQDDSVAFRQNSLTNNNNKQICIAPLGRNFRGAGARQCVSVSGIFDIQFQGITKLLSLL